MSSTLYVGIDVSARSNAVCCMASDGTDLSHYSVDNNLPGARQLVESLLQLHERYPFESLVIGLEATGQYGYHLHQFLLQEPSLQPLNPQVHLFNPKLVSGFKKAYPSLPKTDTIDAWVIADRLRFGRLPAPGVPDERYQALQRLTRTRHHLVKELMREKQRALDALFLQFSGLVQDKPVSNLFGATILSLVDAGLCTETLAAMPLEELVQRVVQSSRNRFDDPQAVAQALQKAARSSYRLPKAMADPVNFVLATHLSIIRTLEKQIAEIDRAIEPILATIPNTLSSVKGLGPVLIAGLIAEIGDIHRFPGHPALAKHAGLAWSKHQSGQFTAQDTHLIHSGNRYLRYYLIEAACRLAVHDAEFRRYYQRKKAESKTHAHKRALALTARKLVRLVDRLLRSGRLYQPMPG